MMSEDRVLSFRVEALGGLDLHAGILSGFGNSRVSAHPGAAFLDEGTSPQA